MTNAKTAAPMTEASHRCERGSQWNQWSGWCLDHDEQDHCDGADQGGVPRDRQPANHAVAEVTAKISEISRSSPQQRRRHQLILGWDPADSCQAGAEASCISRSTMSSSTSAKKVPTTSSIWLNPSAQKSSGW